ncbi:hypothetical protein [Butyrivibrio proteoclasticus]|uniref:hypothetical protein n=1 Tax=Butyrivibrio proteoclasticus TaxID=43305 RepID=UPI00047D6C2D|nr:hypothetical protein [Butyrivibrio proteoclasticus]
MNNQAEIFRQENDEMIMQLIESLDAIIKKFDEGVIPGDPEKADALYMLNKYLDSLIGFKARKMQAFSKVKDNSERKFDEEEIISELLEKKEYLKQLVRIGWEKMIPVNDTELSDGKDSLLVDEGYLDEIVTGSKETHYYVLSNKGEKTLKSKKLFSKIRKDLSTSVIPQAVVNESFKWSNLYVRRVEMINEYFKRLRGNAEHIIFSLDNSKDMVFGCEVDGSADVNYVFAGIFDEKIDEHISKLKGIANSGLVDQIIILNSSEDGRALLEGEGLNTKALSNIRYEIIK